MALKEELETAVAEIFKEPWTERDGQVVPAPEEINLGNDAIKLDARRSFGYAWGIARLT